MWTIQGGLQWECQEGAGKEEESEEWLDQWTDLQEDGRATKVKGEHRKYTVCPPEGESNCCIYALKDKEVKASARAD